MDTDRAFIEKVKTIGVIVKTPEQLPYGTGSRGRMLSAEETGGRPILNRSTIKNFASITGTIQKHSITRC